MNGRRVVVTGMGALTPIGNNLKEYWYQSSRTEFVSSFAYGTFVKNPEEVWQYMLKNGVETRPLICGSMGRQPFWNKINKLE